MSVARNRENGQITPIDHVSSEAVTLGDESAKLRMHFRRATGDVDRRNSRTGERIETMPHRFGTHRFAPVGPRIDMAVPTRLIAHSSQVELEYLDRPRREGRRSGIEKRLLERRHERVTQDTSLLFGVGKRAGLSQQALQGHGKLARRTGAGNHSNSNSAASSVSAAALRCIRRFAIVDPFRFAGMTPGRRTTVERLSFAARHFDERVNVFE